MDFPFTISTQHPYKSTATGEESRWRRSRTWTLPPPTNTAKTHLWVAWFTLNIYWMLTEDLRLPKGKKISCNKVGQKKEGERNRDRTCTPGREMWRKKGSPALGSPVTFREINLDGGGASEPWRKSATTGYNGRTYTDGSYLCPVYPGWHAHLFVWWGSVPKLRLQSQTQGKRDWQCRDSLKRLESGN